MPLSKSKAEFSHSPRLMGSAFELVVVHHDATLADQLLKEGVAEITRIEDLLSEFIPSSITSQINQNAGIQPIIVPPEVFQLIERCQQIAELSKGAFDITVKPLKHIYNFKNTAFQFPQASLIQSTLDKVGYKKLILNSENQSVFLNQKNMQISFAAIGKGYAADQVKKLWQSKGLQSGVINASGDLTSFGQRADGTPWNLGIAHPDNNQKLNYHLPVSNASIATSGDYEQFFTYQGKRYSHSIHPITGLPTSGIKSVSVFSPSAELSDALATAVFIMGVQSGLHFINQLPITHCIIIDENNTSYFSDAIELHTVVKKTKEQIINPSKPINRFSGEDSIECVSGQAFPLGLGCANGNNKSDRISRFHAATIGIWLFCCLMLTSCATVPNYQRIYLNDSEMQMGQTAASGFETYIHTIREGATPANGTKTSGGCGCN